jgi:hypothetical protein
MPAAARPDDAAARAATRVWLTLFVLEGALLIAAVGLYKASTWSHLLTPRPAGLALWAGTATALAAAVSLRRQWRRSTGTARRAAVLALAGNGLAVALAVLGAEAALRLWAARTPEEVRVGTLRLPRTWAETRAHNRQLIRKATAAGGWWESYFVADSLLGWSIGANRRSRNGLYYSSLEGLRSSGPDVAFATQTPRRRIALVGDSYTFSMDVPYEDSWGHHLQQQLGSDVQVLNFGVDGYGIDQAWLRYQRDARPWRPDVVLFGLIQHDLSRTLATYAFISLFPEFPFARPRFVLRAGQLQLLNTPLISPDEIIAHEAITDLPFLETDIGYQQSDWRWRRDRMPLLLRLFATAVPRWPPPNPEFSDDAAIAISGRILQTFLAAAASDGSRARVLYFPSRGAGDFEEPGAGSRAIAREMLAAYVPDHLDLTACVRAVNPAERIMPGESHYTGVANAAVARCVADDLRRWWD